MADYIHLQHEFLTKNQPIPKRKNKYLILCFGDCFTKGWKAYQTQGWPHYLALFLPDNVEIWNVAIGNGAGTYLSVLISRFFISLNPDLIIIHLMRPGIAPLTLKEKDIFHSLLMKDVDLNQLWFNLVESRLRNIILARYKEERSFEVWHTLMNQDISKIYSVLSHFNCPTIFIANDHKHPYFKHANEAIKIIEQDVIKKEDSLIVTDFDGPEWEIKWDHPNNRRDIFTALFVCEKMQKLGWQLTWHASQMLQEYVTWRNCSNVPGRT